MDQDTTRLHLVTSKLAPRARGLLLAAACTSLLATAGCGDDGVSSGPGGGQGSGGAGSTTSSSSGGGGDTTTTTSTSSGPVYCSHLEIGQRASIHESCGVFVNPDAGPGGDGSQASPFHTVQAAAERITALGGGAIYVCGGGNHDLTSAFEMPAESSLAGGFRCSNWQAGSETPTIRSAPNAHVVRAQGPGVRELERLRLIASAEGTDAQGRGRSAIAIMLIGAELRAKDVDIEAGPGAPGADGGEPAAPNMAPNGQNGTNGCMMSIDPQPGGPGGQNTCPLPDGITTVMVNGGTGGTGRASASGLAGTAGVGPAGLFGAGGQPQQPSSAVPGLILSCQPGGNGLPGEVGVDALPAIGGSLGATGYIASVAENALRGFPGGGGGGGGGARYCSDPAQGIAYAGPGGGGGGAGGCGGLGGVSGKPGGASIAILALADGIQASVVHLDDVRFSGATGGDGGDGQSGQDGQLGGGNDSTPAGGSQGSGNNFSAACRGGAGGNGGRGGHGAGGNGGIAALIATDSSSTVTRVGTVDDAAPVAGVGGDSYGNPGDNGVACARFDIPSWGCLPN